MRRLWEIEDVFHAASALEGADRAALLEGCAPEVRREVESLLANLDGAEASIEARMNRPARACAADTPLREGARIGPHRLIRRIGAGGMGAVYLAIREDGEFQQTVAIKLVAGGMDPGWAATRFRYERQLLARLTHPNIARLLDGGSTADDVPYLVMEYVEGRSIVDHSRERRLAINDRLKLFLGVCDAASYAHRNLIVHRDVKPGNIIVNGDGVPKLLDFGISKLLDGMPARGDAISSPTVRIMTPAYASPEQVRGDPVTTATDVYSLGAVLYELLTGQPPHRIVNLAPAELERAICQTDPPKASAVAGRALAGDLDNIVARAMHKDPARRYASVDQFGEDIRRYLAGRTVIARPDTLRYRTNKFVRRHRAAVAAGALLVLALIGGMAATAWQAHRVAVQVARAERRFLQFRKLANAFLFDFHDRIEKLKDLSEARELVLNTGMEYVDGLARDIDGDPILARELARAYEKFGDVQGFRYESALSRPAAAAASYRKAIALIEPLESAGTADPEAVFLRGRSSCSLGEVLERTGDSTHAGESYRQCLDAASWVLSRQPNSRKHVLLVARAYQLLAGVEASNGERDAALARYESVFRTMHDYPRAFKDSRAIWLADTRRRLGRLQRAAGNEFAALGYFEQAATILRASHAPAERKTREALWVYMDLARQALRISKRGFPAPEAAPIAGRALDLARSLAAAHPRQPVAQEDLHAALELHSLAAARRVLPVRSAHR